MQFIVSDKNYLSPNGLEPQRILAIPTLGVAAIKQVRYNVPKNTHSKLVALDNLTALFMFSRLGQSQGLLYKHRRCRLRHSVINRPGVAGAVLQTPPSLIH